MEVCYGSRITEERKNAFWKIGGNIIMNEVFEDCGRGSENGINLLSTSFCSWVGGFVQFFVFDSFIFT